jgi:hypothetical protein
MSKGTSKTELGQWPSSPQDVLNFVPSFPKINLIVPVKRCIQFTLSEITNVLVTRVFKNPHQTVAVFFLLGMGALFFQDNTKFSNELGNVSGSHALKMDQAKSDNDEGDDKSILQHAPVVNLPSHFHYLASSNATVPATPVLWSIPRSGGATVKDILGKCRGMVIAGDWVGQADSLEIVFENGMRQITAELSTKESRLKARDLGLKDAHPNMLILSGNLFETSDVFPGSYQAELWTWFRSPIERQISYYFWLQSLNAGHPQYIPSIKTLSLADWAQTPYHIPNAMLTSLLGVPTNPLGWTEMDLTVAKNLIREKAKIGLLEHKTESIRRFLHLHAVGINGARECQERLLDYAWSNKGHYSSVGKKSNAYQLLMQSNSLDIKLYEYAQYLFRLQKEMFTNRAKA